MLSQVSSDSGVKTVNTFVQERVRAALIAIIVGAPVYPCENCAGSTAWNLITKKGNWREVLQNRIFWIVHPDTRLAIVPISIAESLCRAGLDYRSLKEMCDGLSGENGIADEDLAFTFLTGLLVGYTIHRRAEASDEKWLGEMLARVYPQIAREVRESELQKFRPFFEQPNQFVMTEDPIQTAILNTLVAIHNVCIQDEWKRDHNYSSANLVAERLYGACPQGVSN